MNYLLQRYSDNRDSTLGLMFKKILVGTETNLAFKGYSLEDEFRVSKAMGETRIPAGLYELVIRHEVTPKTKQYQEKYPWFEKHIEVAKVPGFVGIYIHIGNTDGDTDGCILLGDSADNNVIAPGTIASSTACFKRFYLELYSYLKEGNKAFLEIRDEKSLL